MKKIIFLLSLLFIFSCSTQRKVSRDIDPVNVGTIANDGTGDPLRTAMQKLNANDLFLNTNKLNISDTTGMLSDYINKADTVGMLATYILKAEVEGDYLAIPDTAAALDPYLLETDHIPFSQVDMGDGDAAELEDYAIMLSDTMLFKTFEFGSGLIKDTADFYNGAIKTFYNAGSDTLAITSLMGVMAEGYGTESVGVQVSWHATLKSGSATNLNASAVTITSVTTGNEDVSFANDKIPPGVFVWSTLSGITSGNKPSYLGVNLSGYRIPGILSSEPPGGCTYTQNLVTYSEQLDNGAWYKSAGISVSSINADYDLDGNATLEQITTTTGTSSIRNYEGTNAIIVVPGTTYRFSFDVKRGTMTELKYSVYDATNSANIVAPTSYYASTSTSVQRVSFEFTAPAGCTEVYVYPSRESTALGTFYCGRLQVEENGSCYVETTSSIVTP